MPDHQLIGPTDPSSPTQAHTIVGLSKGFAYYWRVLFQVLPIGGYRFRISRGGEGKHVPGFWLPSCLPVCLWVSFEVLLLGWVSFQVLLIGGYVLRFCLRGSLYRFCLLGGGASV